ncbi:outer membrane beta-barrel protein [Solitalea koreensis]|uniref:Outer membrane protein beta-barrel domain-containing protein n=1 Tax=Solitalea koreensis TaxID=543615 RepID=A0A521C4X7_9SPHI|nr:outer membrane beta-barrel protein [Solitalea koreensis]SMO54468.1 Outer membrane protein beta-barrel domain-containing protein [Solitalea koreensis]
MKKLFTLLAMFLLVQAQAQTINFTPFAGYVFDDHVDYSNGYGTVKGGFIYGGTLEYVIQDVSSVGLLYQHQDSQFDGFTGLAILPTNFDLGGNYMLLQGTRYFPVANDKVKPYAGLGAGVAWFNNKATEESLTKFGWDFHLGAKFSPSDRFGIKIQAQLMSAVQAAGGSFYVGTGGVGTGVSGYSTIYQFGLTGGIAIALGH